MTVVWVVLAIVAVLIVGSLGYVRWRDRRPITSADAHATTRAAGRSAAAEAGRRAADRHGAQGDTWDRGRLDGQA
jgi:hypothetical protein